MAHLTTDQKTALKAAVLADATAAAFFNSGDLGGLADYMNAAASPAFTVWKVNVPITQVGDNLNGTELSGLSSLNHTRLQTVVLLGTNGVNPSLADRRAMFDDIFSGAGGATTRTQLLALWKRSASRVEKLFSTGTGSDASPATSNVDKDGAYIQSPIDYTHYVGL